MVWAMGKGDPVNAAETMVTYLYKFGHPAIQHRLRKQRRRHASSLICLVFSIFYQRILVREER